LAQENVPVPDGVHGVVVALSVVPGATVYVSATLAGATPAVHSASEPASTAPEMRDLLIA
jgi:hypothetical protein